MGDNGPRLPIGTRVRIAIELADRIAALDSGPLYRADAWIEASGKQGVRVCVEELTSPAYWRPLGHVDVWHDGSLSMAQLTDVALRVALSPK